MRAVRIRSIGLSDVDVRKLVEIQNAEGIHSKAETVRRLIDLKHVELKRGVVNKNGNDSNGNFLETVYNAATMAVKKKELAKERNRAYQRAYYQRPEDKERRRAYNQAYYQRPEVKERRRVYMRAYGQKPKAKERNRAYQRAYQQKPEVKARTKKYRQRPEVKERRKIYSRAWQQRPEVKERNRAYKRAYYQKPEVKERRRIYGRKYYRRVPEVKSQQQLLVYMYYVPPYDKYFLPSEFVKAGIVSERLVYRLLGHLKEEGLIKIVIGRKRNEKHCYLTARGHKLALELSELPSMKNYIQTLFINYCLNEG